MQRNEIELVLNNQRICSEYLSIGVCNIPCTMSLIQPILLTVTCSSLHQYSLIVKHNQRSFSSYIKPVYSTVTILCKNEISRHQRVCTGTMPKWRYMRWSRWKLPLWLPGGVRGSKLRKRSRYWLPLSINTILKVCLHDLHVSLELETTSDRDSSWLHCW